jgi:hypothetical protein
MALVECAECGRGVNSRARKCPGCGCRIKRQYTFVERLSGWTLGAAIVTGLVWIGHVNTPDEATRRVQLCENSDLNKRHAYTMAKEFVIKQLRAPSTAVFPGFNNEGVKADSIDTCKFRIVGFVDAQNGFGAQIRSTYSMDLSYEPGTNSWKASNLWMLSR